ncbi:MAG: DNA starvation/stationary phase protection protein Dps [Tessaracoccus sp.]
MAKKSSYTVPGLSGEAGGKAVEILQGRLNEYNDLQLTLKHVHWNVVGPNFIGVHEMIDPQVDLVRLYADAVAERIAALGGSPRGTVGGIAEDRALPEYPLGRNTALEHLKALDGIYDVVITDNREAITVLEELDVVTQDLVIGQTAELEKFQWFVRAHLENPGGQLP